MKTKNNTNEDFEEDSIKEITTEALKALDNLYLSFTQNEQRNAAGRKKLESEVSSLINELNRHPLVPRSFKMILKGME